ncbi:hypothetical protein BpHYR1_043399 [Brachionus plicatilis]|uniref:Uncharacterized protein n=1 Tax=Brachionus plicatilis TaxID=10195 RepID=A0A3M7RKG3_BRAPC|nr:hypothetical protein BpHYR1_043399 [Brachionus plicatilis]
MNLNIILNLMFMMLLSTYNFITEQHEINCIKIDMVDLNLQKNFDIISFSSYETKYLIYLYRAITTSDYKKSINSKLFVEKY